MLLWYTKPPCPQCMTGAKCVPPAHAHSRTIQILGLRFRVLLQVERYVLRLLGAVQRRRGAADPAPYEAFARQDAAFRWADAHPLAAELRCAVY